MGLKEGLHQKKNLAKIREIDFRAASTSKNPEKSRVPLAVGQQPAQTSASKVWALKFSQKILLENSGN